MRIDLDKNYIFMRITSDGCAVGPLTLKDNRPHCVLTDFLSKTIINQLSTYKKYFLWNKFYPMKWNKFSLFSPIKWNKN